MLTAAYICLVIVCVIAGTFYSIRKKLDVVGVAIKLFAPLSCAILAVVSANLSSAVGGQSMFVLLGLLFVIIAEGIGLAQDKGTVSLYIQNGFLSAAYACFMGSALVHGAFNGFALGFGIFVAIGTLLIGLALNDKRKNLHFWISNAILLAFLGAFFGQGIAFLHDGTHLVASILYLAAGALVTASHMCNLFKRDDYAFVSILSAALNIAGLIAISSSIFFL